MKAITHPRRPHNKWDFIGAPIGSSGWTPFDRVLSWVFSFLTATIDDGSTNATGEAQFLRISDRLVRPLTPGSLPGIILPPLLEPSHILGLSEQRPAG